MVWLTFVEGGTYNDNRECFMVERGIKPTFYIGLLMTLTAGFVVVTKNLKFSLLLASMLLIILIIIFRKGKLNWLRKVKKEEFLTIKSSDQRPNILHYFMALIIAFLVSALNLFIGILTLGLTTHYCGIKF